MVLVDKQDRAIGQMEKMQAHREGRLHRAFSIFLFNDAGDMLLQRRAQGKYHSPGLWSNACCSHPRPGEPILSAAQRRLKEEMGLECELLPAFTFSYRAEFDNGLIENEFDHVLFGFCCDNPTLNPEEADAFDYRNLSELESELRNSPDRFTRWLAICFDRVREQLAN